MVIVNWWKQRERVRGSSRPQPAPHAAATPENTRPWILSYVSYPYECCTSQNSCARCSTAEISVSGMSQAVLRAGIEYFNSSEMQSRYFDEDIFGEGVNVDELISPGGRQKEIRVKSLSGFAKEKALFTRRRKLDLHLATSLKFVNFQANCEPGEVFSKVWKLFKNAKSVKIGKIKTKPEERSEKTMAI